ncbi:MAG TPA: nuclease-related domain-containing protein [Actinomycetota bacterium]|nr:nuclease-related domain-containing protein [Actinomycetota bacterium]
MARMVPFPMLPTESSAERRLYEWFLHRLDDDYVVYHSVDWVLRGPKGADEGEADFVVTHPRDGLLVVEAKGGGLAYDAGTRTWTQSGRGGTHRLDEDTRFTRRETSCTTSRRSWRRARTGSGGSRRTATRWRSPTRCTTVRPIRAPRPRS